MQSSEKPFTFVSLNRYSETDTIMFSTRHLHKDRIVPAHWHNYIELEIVKEGTAKHFISNRSYDISEGSAYIITSSDNHMIIPTSNITLFNLSVMRGIIDPELEKYIISRPGKFHCKLETAQLSYVTELIERAENESTNAPFSALMTKNIAEELFVALIRTSDVDEVVSDPPLIQKAIITVNDRFLNQLTLREVAEELYVSPNYLGSLFKSKVGVSFNTYLTMTRLRFACGLLNSTSKSIKEIAMESGFGSTEYFLSRFKKFMKCTPTEYRELSLPM